LQPWISWKKTDDQQWVSVWVFSLALSLKDLVLVADLGSMVLSISARLCAVCIVHVTRLRGESRHDMSAGRLRYTTDRGRHVVITATRTRCGLRRRQKAITFIDMSAPCLGYAGDGTFAIRIVSNRLDKRFRI